MITYERTAFGVGLFFQLRGSALYRAMIPGLVSVAVSVLMSEIWLHRKVTDDWRSNTHPDNGTENNQLLHPYVVGVLVGTISFLLIFRMQQGYARYWEACGAIHQMMSKWLDAVSHTAVYHMQCAHYDQIKPPSFFEYPELDSKNLTRYREYHTLDEAKLGASAAMSDPCSSSSLGSGCAHLDPSQRAVLKSIESVKDMDYKKYGTVSRRNLLHPKGSSSSSPNLTDDTDSALISDANVRLEGDERLDGNWGALFRDGTATYLDTKHPDRRDPAGFASIQGGRTPPLFLQELAHLASLLVAVAFSTLRNDLEGRESPLGVYVPGSPWPPVDPGKDKELIVHNLGLRTVWYQILNFVGCTTDEKRSMYNASRPLPVLGGVSEGEIRFLQMARGASAKTQLCWNWLSEFVTREHLAGSTGNVGPPIISRIIQFLGDGMIFYNHARKIVFIPFPFPHAQLSTVYVMVMLVAVPYLMNEWTQDLWAAAVFSFVTSTALVAINEVARELEKPFRNVPNEIPLVTLQAQFNEALIVMFAGYHPDFFWAERAESILNNSKRKNRRSASRTSSTASETGSSMSTAEKSSTKKSTDISLEDQMRLLMEKVCSSSTVEKSSTKKSSKASLEDQVSLLMEKVSQQEKELEKLRSSAFIEEKKFD